MDTIIDTIMDSTYRYQFTDSGYMQLNMDTSYFLWILQAYLKMSGMDTSVFLMDNCMDINTSFMDTTGVPQNVRHGYFCFSHG